MSKVTSVFIIALLLCGVLTYAARPEPAFPEGSLAKSQHGGVEAENVDSVDESCEGVGEEECLMRRTLTAHIDYIYTQNKKP